jgi:hypothetical protein
MAHGQELARIAQAIRQPGENSAALGTLLRAFLEAKQFIHFTTYGISLLFIGALKTVSQKVRV